MDVATFLRLAHMGGADDWWIELGLPLVVLVVLYYWSQRGERRKTTKRRDVAVHPSQYKALSDGERHEDRE